jgi:hypothetical protein
MMALEEGAQCKVKSHGARASVIEKGNKVRNIDQLCPVYWEPEVGSPELGRLVQSCPWVGTSELGSLERRAFVQSGEASVLGWRLVMSELVRLVVGVLGT